MENNNRVRENSHILVKVSRERCSSCPFDVGGELATHK